MTSERKLTRSHAMYIGEGPAVSMSAHAIAAAGTGEKAPLTHPLHSLAAALLLSLLIC